MKNDLKDKIDKGNKRLALVCCIWTALVSIPLLLIHNVTESQWMGCVMMWFGFILIGIIISPMIVNKIWK